MTEAKYEIKRSEDLTQTPLEYGPYKSLYLANDKDSIPSLVKFIVQQANAYQEELN